MRLELARGRRCGRGGGGGEISTAAHSWSQGGHVGTKGTKTDFCIRRDNSLFVFFFVCFVYLPLLCTNGSAGCQRLPQVTGGTHSYRTVADEPTTIPDESRHSRRTHEGENRTPGEEMKRLEQRSNAAFSAAWTRNKGAPVMRPLRKMVLFCSFFFLFGNKRTGAVLESRHRWSVVCERRRQTWQTPSSPVGWTLPAVTLIRSVLTIKCPVGS